MKKLVDLLSWHYDTGISFKIRYAIWKWRNRNTDLVDMYKNK